MNTQNRCSRQTMNYINGNFRKEQFIKKHKKFSTQQLQSLPLNFQIGWNGSSQV